MASGTVPVGVGVFGEADTKPEEELKEKDLPSQPDPVANPVPTEESPDSGPGLSMEFQTSEAQEMIHFNSDGVDLNTSPGNTSIIDQGEVIPGDPTSTCTSSANYDSDDSVQAPTNSVTEVWTIFTSIYVFFFFCAMLKVDVSPSNDSRGPSPQCATSTNSFIHCERTFLEENVDPSVLPPISQPDYEMENDGISRGVDVPFANDTFHNQSSEVQPCSDEEQRLDIDLHAVNGTANEESYMDIMMRQETGRQQNHQNVVHTGHHDLDTCSNDMVQNTAETRSSDHEGEGHLQGVPHGGWIWWTEPGFDLINTCNLDQLLNGLYQIFRFPPLQQLLEMLAETFPDAYQRLWVALLYCEAGQFPEAKAYLVPDVRDMLSSEGLRVMPLIEMQLCHWMTTLCERCQHSPTGQPVYICNISLGRFDRLTGFQEAFRSVFFPRNGICSQDGCGGQTTTSPVFYSGPPLIMAANLKFLRDSIPNSQAVDESEILELFGIRYMMFLFSFARPDGQSPQGQFIPGHYMSRVYIPHEDGGIDRQGRPIGSWYFYPNNWTGQLSPWTPYQVDPEGTHPSYVFFIQIPAPSEGATAAAVQGEEVQEEEEGPQRDADDMG